MVKNIFHQKTKILVPLEREPRVNFDAIMSVYVKGVKIVKLKLFSSIQQTINKFPEFLLSKTVFT